MLLKIIWDVSLSQITGAKPSLELSYSHGLSTKSIQKLLGF